MDSYAGKRTLFDAFSLMTVYTKTSENANGSDIIGRVSCHGFHLSKLEEGRF